MDITRRRGDTYPDEVSIQMKGSKEVVNLTGCTFLLTLDTKPNPTDSTTQVYQLVGDVDTLKGKVSFAPTLQQSDRLGYYYFDIQMTYPTGQVRTLDNGLYIYLQDITK